MSRTQTTPKPGQVSRALAQDRLGVPSVLFFVLAGVAPLTVAAGVIPTAYAVTGLTGIPAAFIVVAVIMGLFAVGYVAMTRHITNSGAFYAFISRGLGKPLGVAAALIAVLAYNFLQVGLYGALGPAAQGEAAQHLGVHLSWWVWALIAWAIITFLGLLRVDITGWVLGVLLSVEVVVIIAETISGLLHPAHGHLSFATLSPSGLTASGFGTVGVLAVIAVLGFIGFEQAPVLAEEAKNARRTIPIATYLSLGLIAIVYAGASWAMAASAGTGQVVKTAQTEGPGLLFGLGDSALSNTAQFLFMTSLFAAALAFHNAVWRYMYSLGRESVLPSALGRTGGNNIPKAASLVQSFIGLAVILALRGGRLEPDERPVLLARHHRRVRHPGAVRPDVDRRDRVLQQGCPGREPVAAGDRPGHRHRPADPHDRPGPDALRRPARGDSQQPGRVDAAGQLPGHRRARGVLGADPAVQPPAGVRVHRPRRARRARARRHRQPPRMSGGVVTAGPLTWTRSARSSPTRSSTCRRPTG